MNSAVVGEPVIVCLEGRESELTLSDAKTLLAGLQAAVALVEELKASQLAQNNGHTIMYGKSEQGMTVATPSKLYRSDKSGSA